MKLFLISQTVNDNYDTFSDAVVVAPTEDEARRMHPGGVDYGNQLIDGVWYKSYTTIEDPYRDHTWAPVADVRVIYLGEAADPTPRVICASFHAG